MQWEVQLAGDPFDLDELVLVMSETDPSINQTERGYMLRYSEFEKLTTHEEVETVAEELLKSLNGISSVLIGTRTPITVAFTGKRNAQGGWDVLGRLTSTVGLRDLARTTITNPDGTVTTSHPADPAAAWLKLSLTDSNVAKVFRLLTPPPASWDALYKIHEVIIEDMGGTEAIHSGGWMTDRAMRRFGHSANSPTASGDQARHGTEPAQPPANPMPLSEARALILTLVHNWLRHKQGSLPQQRA